MFILVIKEIIIKLFKGKSGHKTFHPMRNLIGHRELHTMDIFCNILRLINFLNENKKLSSTFHTILNHYYTAYNIINNSRKDN